MEKEYAARVCADGRVQTVKEHTNGVVEKAHRDAETLGCLALVTLVCYLHDMGKNTSYSDRYQHTVGKGEEWLCAKPIHSHAGAKYIDEQKYSEKEADPIVSSLVTELAQTIIMSHHGLFDCLRPADCNGEFNGLKRKLGNNDYDYEEAQRRLLSEIISADELGALFRRAEEETLQICMKLKEIAKEKSEMSFYIALLYRMLLSILVNADHTDAAEFSSGEAVASVYGDTALWKKCSTYLEEKLTALPTQMPIQMLRREISQKVFETAREKATVVRLSIPTGGGKTLTGLRYAVNHALCHHKSRIIYVAPFNSILEQNAAQFKEFLPEGMEILEHFGDMIDYETANGDYRYYTENWGSPVIATSMVQFLNTLFDGKMSSVRRMRGLLNSVIILDEVQSVPVECISLFNMAVNFLACICGCTVVLCTATQPTFDRLQRHNIRLSDHCELLDDYDSYAERFKRTQITDSRKRDGYTYDEAADFVLRLTEDSASVLLVVNTKSASQTVYKHIRERLAATGTADEYTVIHLSTNMCPAHRKKALSELKSSLKKNRKVICVSTQLIEAGVDISFAAVIRSLSGLDSIIQAAGRCNRHGETETGTVHIINLSEEDISKIKTIRIGAAITRSLLEAMRKEHKLFNGDIGNPAAVERYYDRFYAESASELDYQVKVNSNLNTTMYQLLSTNRGEVLDLAKAYRDDDRNIWLNQSFKTAGELFKAIDDYQQTVLVPYGEGKALIRQLFSSQGKGLSTDFFRSLQPYSIGLSDKQCEGRVVKDEATGILVLKEGYYHEEYGFDAEGEMDLMFI